MLRYRFQANVSETMRIVAKTLERIYGNPENSVELNLIVTKGFYNDRMREFRTFGAEPGLHRKQLETLSYTRCMVAHRLTYTGRFRRGMALARVRS